jgi:hypothetical protein
MKYWYYTGKATSHPAHYFIIRVRAARRPKNSDKTWVVQELLDNDWVMPPFPEIGYRRLSRMIFLGSEKCPSQ